MGAVREGVAWACGRHVGHCLKKAVWVAVWVFFFLHNFISMIDITYLVFINIIIILVAIINVIAITIIRCYHSC